MQTVSESNASPQKGILKDRSPGKGMLLDASPMSNPTGQRVKIADQQHSSKQPSTLKGRIDAAQRSLKASDYDYGEEGYSESSPGKQSMGPSYYTEDASEMQQEIIEQSRVNEGLENRLDQIKHSIKN